MKTSFSEISKIPRGQALPESVNSLMRNAAERLVDAEDAPTTVFKFRKGVCQSCQSEILFRDPKQAFEVAEAKRWFGELRVEKSRCVFMLNTINDNVDFNQAKADR